MTQDNITIPLKRLQSVFKQYLTGHSDTIAEHIVSTSGLGNDVRLAIYSNAYVGRLVEALEQDFPSIKFVLGEPDFYAMCEQYIHEHPSVFPSLRFFGQYMPEFLLNTEPYRGKSYLYELATLEWCFIDAFDAVDVAVASESDIAQIEPALWPDMKLVIHPSVQVFSYQWNILPIWRASADGKKLPEIERFPEKQFCMVWRQGLSTQYRTLASDEYVMLEICRRGGTFAEICETLASSADDAHEVPMRAATIIKSWLSQGVISKFDTS